MKKSLYMLMTAISALAISFSSWNMQEIKCETVSTETITIENEVISLEEFIVTVFGVDYHLPDCIPSDFINNGYELSSRNFMDKCERFFHESDDIAVDIGADWSNIEGGYDNESKTPPEAYYNQPIIYFSCEGSRKEEKNCILPRGIACRRSTYDDVIAAYGEPDEEEINPDYITNPRKWVKYNNFAGAWSLCVVFANDSGGEVQIITFQRNS